MLFGILENKSDSINVILSSTLFIIAFFFAIAIAPLLMSVAVISQLSIYFARDTAIIPLPVHKSKIFFSLFFFSILITSSTNFSVSALGIIFLTFLYTQNIFFLEPPLNYSYHLLLHIAYPFLI